MTPKCVAKRQSWTGGKRRSPPRKDPLFCLLLAEIGLQELMAVLELSGQPRALALLDLLSDPAYSRHTLATLCGRIGLTFVRLFDIYRRVQICRGIILMANHLPDVMEDVAIDSISRCVTCHACAGSGHIATDSDLDAVCTDCRGSGTLRIPGDAASRKLFMKLVETIQTKPPMNPKPACNFPSLEETLMLAESALEADRS